MYGVLIIGVEKIDAMCIFTRLQISRFLLLLLLASLDSYKSGSTPFRTSLYDALFSEIYTNSYTFLWVQMGCVHFRYSCLSEMNCYCSKHSVNISEERISSTAMASYWKGRKYWLTEYGLKECFIFEFPRQKYCDIMFIGSQFRMHYILYITSKSYSFF